MITVAGNVDCAQVIVCIGVHFSLETTVVDKGKEDLRITGGVSLGRTCGVETAGSSEWVAEAVAGQLTDATVDVLDRLAGKNEGLKARLGETGEGIGRIEMAAAEKSGFVIFAGKRDNLICSDETDVETIDDVVAEVALAFA